MSSGGSSTTSAAATAADRGAADVNNDIVQHYIFGYGSLICPESRKLTNPNLTAQALPVLVKNVERRWSARSTKNAYTAMDIVKNQEAECTGVLLPINTEQELADLDRREASYERWSIPLSDIQRVDFLKGTEHYDFQDEDDHPVFLAQQRQQLDAEQQRQQKKTGMVDDNNDDNNDHEDDNPDETTTTPNNVKVWMYMHTAPMEPDPSHPIPQSYVDIILRGCLKISKEFAQTFIETTDGWQSDADHWVEDRDDPLYVRADMSYSNRHGPKIDQLLEDHLDHLDDLTEERVMYNPHDHLEALEEALEDDNNLAHPKAIERIEAKVEEQQQQQQQQE